LRILRRGIRIIIALGLGLGTLGALAPAGLAAPDVLNVRRGHHGDADRPYTRFVLDLSAAVDYQIFTLPDPYRVVIDMPQTDWNLDDAQRRRATEAVGYTRGFRYGLFRPGVSRVVIDLNRPVDILRHKMLPPDAQGRYRLYIDLAPLDHETFMVKSREMRAQLAALRPTPPEAVAPAAPRGDTRRVVVIDAGHGGVDPGAISASGVYEKSLTLAAAHRVQRVLESTGRYRAILTRDDDVFLPLRERYQFAQSAEAQLFISLHADTNPNGEAQGASLYTISEKASDAEAAALAAKENKADVIAGMDLNAELPEVANILIDLARRETQNQSRIFANLLVDELGRRTTLLGRPHRHAGFAVLKAPDVPSVLVEMGFLSNSRDERRLRTDGFRDTLGDAVLAAADRFFATVNPQNGRAPAQR
jgi:N-acetylmuramoyl-L-alanine amidase